jgi:hypothetical protein
MKAEVPRNFGWAAALGIATAPFLLQAAPHDPGDSHIQMLRPPSR